VKVPTINSKRARLGVLTVAAIAALAGTSQASHWNNAGGGEGHPGFQPTDPSALPLEPRGTGGSGVLGSPVVTGGLTLADQRIVYPARASAFPTDEQTIVRTNRFTDGGQVASVDLDDDTVEDSDGWGTTNLVHPVVASDHNSAGQIYAIYNDDDSTKETPLGADLAIAQLDGTTGALVTKLPFGDAPAFLFGGLDAYTIDAPPVISGDLGSGTRQIAAIIRTDDSTEKSILLVTIPNAAATGDNVSDMSYTVGPNIPDANPLVAPAFVRMRDPGSGTRVNMIAVSTTDGVKTWRTNNLGAAGAGPSVAGLGPVQTISVPVRSDGNPATSVSCPPQPACSPPIYTVSQTAGEGTVVRRLKQDESDVFNPVKLATLIPTDAQASSPELPGKPSRAIAVEQVIPASGAGAGLLQPGRVIVGTSKNVYSLDTEDLADPDFGRVFPTDRETGFEKTAPAASGGLGFISDDKGQQYVFFTDPDLVNENGSLRVPPDETGFQPHEDALNSTSSINQPAVSRGRVVFGANNGLFVYGPNVAITKPGANAAVGGNTVPLEAYVFNPTLTSTTFFIDGTPVGTDNVNDDRTFSVVWNSLGGILDGPHTIRAEATDGVVTESSANRVFIVNNYLNPTAALTVSPKTANPGEPVLLDARGSAPTPTEAGETITRWAFELDGDNDFDDVVETAAAGGDGLISQAFEPGKHVVGVRVTDSHGDVAQKTDTLRVNAPPAANVVVGPNPAAEGQEVTVDASSSTDADGSIVRYEFDLDGNGTFELDNGANPKVQRVFGPGTTKISARVTDNEGASSVVEATLVVNGRPANQIPVASFKVAPNPANRDQRVLFDATGARDPDGLIVKYEWDLDGNGTFETNSQNNPRVQRSYATAKVYNVKLRVTDNLGAVSTEFTGTLTIRGATARKTPRRLSAKVTPMRDVTLPYDFRTTGKLTRPSGVSAKAGCTGRVTVTVKAGTKTISRRTTRLRSNCTYRTSVRFRDRTRIGTLGALRFTARFQGNKALRARQATTVRVRVG
jgi:hypothetical protein